MKRIKESEKPDWLKEKEKENELFLKKDEENKILKKINITKAELRNTIREELNFIFKQDKFVQGRLKEIVTQNINPIVNEFVKKFESSLMRFIEQEVDAKIKDYNLHNKVKEVIKDKLHYELGDMTKHVVSEIVKQTNLKLRREYEVTKELTYSIDASIRHTMMKSPISLNTEEVVKEKMIRAITLMANKKLIEVQK